MGNCCCPRTSDDYNQLNNEESTRRRRRHHRSVNIPRERRHPQHAEFFRPTSSPMSTSVGNTQQAEEQLKIAQRQGIISQIPTGVYDLTSKKQPECAICMIEFEVGDEIKYLPCMHVYHKDCIDDWLVRSLKCPACMEPVDAALLSSFDSFLT